MTSPGSNVNDSLTHSTISPIDLIIWSELESCFVAVSPSCVRCALIGSESKLKRSRSASIHGPSGAKVSMPFARAHCPSENWRSRELTSLIMVTPRTTDFHWSAFTFLHGTPMTSASSPSNSTRVANLGMRIGAPGPTTAVGGLMKIVGGKSSAVC